MSDTFLYRDYLSSEHWKVVITPPSEELLTMIQSLSVKSNCIASSQDLHALKGDMLALINAMYHVPQSHVLSISLGQLCLYERANDVHLHGNYHAKGITLYNRINKFIEKTQAFLGDNESYFDEIQLLNFDRVINYFSLLNSALAECLDITVKDICVTDEVSRQSALLFYTSPLLITPERKVEPTENINNAYRSARRLVF